ncbi:transcriptional regulator [Amycolatopsis sp. WAC 04182]|uniref:helix-turn-helix domain-containing protein n=1 Tax=Amycolatopsis sp. WAC 04182 TaxID=2203198 RepID=UPI000F7B01FF|nr:helix-turn-helix transcriptional regulator [Amycolatopsis sp. WAC 04182]RSN65399.1 transcriptional regulator [Amycolatopsis sp. WAC 04182]
MASTNETPRAVELGLLLRRFRTRAGLGQQELAAQIGRHHSEISRIERAQRGLDEDFLIAILDAVHVSSEERAQVLTLFREAADPNWLAPGRSRQLTVVRAYEDAADAITNVQPQLIPGPLQTRANAIEVMIATGNTRAEAIEGADFRMARGATIMESGVDFTAIIGEYALRYPVCGREAAVEQLYHLRKLMDVPHITIRAVAMSSRSMAMRRGPFVLIESERTGAVVHLEQVSGSTTMTDAKYVRGYQEAAEALRGNEEKGIRGEAMSTDATSVLIEEIANEMENTT